MNQFNLYRIANLDVEQMVNPMKRAALFLGFIKGPNVKDWVKRWTNWTIDQYTTGRATNDEYYWTTIIHGFEDAFRDTGARERAEMRLTHLLMTPNEVDIFLAQFETMAHEAQYVTCRWHVRLDVSGIGPVANLLKVSVLSTDPEPLLT
jgi:hypothetical protein